MAPKEPAGLDTDLNGLQKNVPERLHCLYLETYRVHRISRRLEEHTEKDDCDDTRKQSDAFGSGGGFIIAAVKYDAICCDRFVQERDVVYIGCFKDCDVLGGCKSTYALHQTSIGNVGTNVFFDSVGHSGTVGLAIDMITIAGCFNLDLEVHGVITQQAAESRGI